MPGLLKIAVYITIAIIIFFLLRKKEKKPSKLEMGLSKHRSSRVNKNALTGVRKVTAEVVDDSKKENTSEIDLIRYNGNIYNVWQILKVPAGANEGELKKAYALLSSEKGIDKNLLHLAYKKAIKLSKKSHDS